MKFIRENMQKKLTPCIFILTFLMLAACSKTVLSLTPTANLTPTLTALPTIVNTPPQRQVPTVTNSHVVTTPTTAFEGISLPDISDSVYLDDRSTPAALMLSYFNAINRREYLRAYSYYIHDETLGTLDEFSSGYRNTQKVRVVVGDISSEGAAGSIYYTIPMVLNATTTSGVQQKFSACYIVRLPQPGNYGAPPITPMHLERGTAKSIPLTTSDVDALASACPSLDFPTGVNVSPASMENLADLSSTNYIDNRSDPEAVIRSLLNALNSQQYVRAYSYWQDPSFTYDSFSESYANTVSVSAVFGAVTSDAGAGQIYYTLPAVLESMLTDGTKQTFSVCYTLHLSQPTFQGTVPFQPLGIQSAISKQVENGADPTTLLSTACP